MTAADFKKRKHPRESANFLSQLFFGWTWPLFWRGWHEPVGVDDMYPTQENDRSHALGDELERIWNEQCELAKKKGTDPSLKKSLIIMFWKKFFLIGMRVAFQELGVRMINPFLLGRLLAYFKPNPTITQNEALAYVGGILLCITLQAFLLHHNTFRLTQFGMQMRIACCSLIYRKAMRLSRTALGDTTAGQVVNLLSNDVSRFDNVVIFINFMWIAPLSALLSAYLLYSVVGPAGMIGVAAIFLIIPLQAYTARLTTLFRTRTALRTDERVRLMDEIICGIHVIKMYAWEKPFSALISLARMKEIREITGMCMLRGFFMTFLLFTTRFALYCTLISYVLMGNFLAASEVYIASSFFNALNWSMGTMFVRGLSEVAELLVCLRRLQKFMMYDEYRDSPGRIEYRPSGDKLTNGGGYINGALSIEDEPKEIKRLKPKTRSGTLVFEDAYACWLPEVMDDTLRNINLNVRPGELIAVIGPVGSGKSSLLQAALGELTLKSGKVHLNGRVSYAAQGPWVRGSSIRSNIMFGAPYNRKRYERVVKACALTTDFASFPQGDLTVVGERGASLSGGQKARVSLARAVYREADIYLLDDPLSAVDVHVGRHLFEECIEGFLSGKTRIVVTHQVQHLKDASRIVIMNHGAIEMVGSFAQLVASDVDYAQLLQAEPDDDEPDGGTTPTGGGDLEHQKSLVRALRRLSRSSIRNSVSSVRSSYCSSRRSSLASAGGSTYDEDYHEDATLATTAQLEASSRGAVRGSLLFKYFDAGSNLCGLFCVVLLFVAAQFFAAFCDAFVGFWTNIEEERRAHEDEVSDPPSWKDLLTTNTCIYIYTGIVVGILLVTITRSVIFFLTCMRCSQKLHDSMFRNLVAATMRFFHTNPSGRILNRFSKDLGAVDELLPKALSDASQVLLNLVGAIVVTTSTFPELIIPVLAILGLFYFIRAIYLRTSKEVKRLEGMTRSPVFSHLNSTLQGLTTIRAFSAQLDQQREFDDHQDLHSASWFMFISTSSTFGFTLDMVGLTFLAIVCFSFVFFRTGSAAGTVGLAISQCFVVTGLVQFGIRQSAEAQNQLMAVERVLEYTKLPPEPEDPPVDRHDGTTVVSPAPPLEKISRLQVDNLPPADWPEHGAVQFNDVRLWYSPHEPPVLRGLTFSILPREKVGIVGRTGAGKSSLIVALFRLAPIRGEITLDGIDITSMPVQVLRSRVSIIPQDPVLFSGTLRYNLDPFGQFPDYALWSALEDVELKAVAEDMHGLDGHVQEGGGNLSVGQRQLLCLARAILRDNRILVLDEATANVDPQTDHLIQKTIKTKFGHCTVLTIAHRLHTIMDSDKVLVMDQGRVSEFEHPHVLIQRHGVLYGMVKDAGHQTAENLTRIAKEAFENRKKEI